MLLAPNGASFPFPLRIGPMEPSPPLFCCVAAAAPNQKPRVFSPMSLFRHTLPFIILWLPDLIFAQNNTRTQQQAEFTVQIARTTETIHLDGELSESVWANAPMASNFWMKWPRDGGPAPEQTEVRCTYDDKFLYIGVVCRDSSPQHVVQSLKRDVGYWDSDGFAVVLDPANAATNGYFFGISTAGVQTEALLATGVDEMDRNWDNTWFTETKIYPDRWTAELAIPFRILRFKEGQTTWGINFIRNDLGNNIYSLWARTPFEFDGTDLGWTGSLLWDTAPRRAKGNYNFSPYITGGAFRDYEAGEKWTTKPNAGLDAKIGVGSGMNLDVTVNPDFSQIEIDEQVINLTRFDVMLPEKRTFFLENADIFGNFGIPPIRPFFSRRVGLNEDGSPVAILGGLRLTGNLNSDTRLGVMSMQTKAKDGNPSQNFSALGLNRRLFGRTTLAGYLVNRESFKDGDRQNDAFSRNAGIEFGHTSTNGKWSAWLTHHRSFKPNIANNNWWGNSGFAYNTRKFNWLFDVTHMGEQYHADIGFERRIENYDVRRDTTLRIGYNFVFNELSYNIFPKKATSKLNFIEIGAELFNVFNPNSSLNESSNALGVSFNYKNSSELSFRLEPSWVNVPVSFKFDDEPVDICPALDPGQYQFVNFGAEWNSDYRKLWFLSVGANAGGFYNGNQYGAKVQFTYRFQPVVNLTLSASYNRLDFPNPYCDVAFFNLTPRVEVFFRRNLWWTTFIQYNNQADNFNINSRLQWRYRPMSDLFLVYTDNYAAQVWGVKSRALVLKMNYWL